jgi:hypothetical protein
MILSRNSSTDMLKLPSNKKSGHKRKTLVYIKKPDLKMNQRCYTTHNVSNRTQEVWAQFGSGFREKS